MNVLFVTSECVPFFKLGGLGDVSYALPVALQKLNINVRIVMPYYESINLPHQAKCVGQLAVDYDRRRELVFVFEIVIPGTHIPVYLFRHPKLNEYVGDDIAQTFAFFSKAVVSWYVLSSHLFGGPYDIIHCHDWHTALVPLLLGENRKVIQGKETTLQARAARTILTIHNLLYQGETGVGVVLRLGLQKPQFHIFTTPLGRAVKLLREGLEYADMVTTVSPTYAREIARGHHGDSIQALLAKRKDRLVGILNGIDTGIWNPKTDSLLPVHYSRGTVMTAKPELKAHLQKALRLPSGDALLFGFVGRLEEQQKGIELIIRAVPHLADRLFQIAILGTGAARQVKKLKKLAKRNPNITFIHTFDERLARRIYAGADVLLVPSKFEPCGLTQLIAMRYGTLPLVRKTGGLADTVVDGKTGFVFRQYTSAALAAKMREAIDLRRENVSDWWKMVASAMKQDFSWDMSAKKYLDLYQTILKT
ncbi:glycogen synthase [Candidatus Gottesmanbacteria bacterium]|nr:glycogen synthase [Candidatus Gottesmanbacteria bacterium]